MNADAVVDSPADCLAVAGSWKNGSYRRKDPPANNFGKPGIVDMDHVSAGSSDVGFVWTAFTRGYHFNLYDKPFESPDAEGPDWDLIRRNVGKAVEYAGGLDLVNTFPADDLASSGFCLAKPGIEYVIYQPQAGPITVSGLNSGKWYSYEFYDTGTGKVADSGRFQASNKQKFFSRVGEGHVLYMVCTDCNGSISKP